MKKLTAGILTVMLGIVSANSADAAVASKLYVDSKAKANADAIAQEVTDRGTAITNLSNTLTTEIGKKVDTTIYEAEVQSLQSQIGEKVAQSDYDTKIGQLEQTDTNISNLVGTLPTGAGVDNVVAYIDKKTTGIATDTALGELSDKVTANTGAIATLNGDASTAGSVAKQIADAVKVEEDARKLADQGLQNSIDAINDGTTGILKKANDYTEQHVSAGLLELSGAVTGMLGEGFSTESTVASQLGAVKATADGAVQEVTTGEANGTISVDGEDVAVKGLGSAAYTDAGAYDVSGAAAQALADAKANTSSQIEALALQAISKVPADCSNMTKYCVLTYGTNGFVWEVIERAEGETGGSSADTL